MAISPRMPTRTTRPTSHSDQKLFAALFLGVIAGALAAMATRRPIAPLECPACAACPVHNGMNEAHNCPVCPTCQKCPLEVVGRRCKLDPGSKATGFSKIFTLKRG